LDFGSSNPIAPGKYITVMKTTMDLCDILNTKSNFLKKFMIDIFLKATKASKGTLKCPFEKSVYQISDWLIDADKIIPKSFTVHGNVSIYAEFLTKSNSSSKKISVYSFRLYFEIKKT
jgi:hypothetical protein